ncbi:MAG: ribosomal RNA small subunit methyltransferase A [Niabella sp.]|nr:ribosomal RNA small subunit methyltransferase A [Niabella sp.]
MYTLKKSLGQHFLKDENICRKIVDAVQAEHPGQLLEVGPGGGAITKYLIALDGVDFKAIEVDAEKVEYLSATYPVLQDKIIHESILDAAAPFSDTFHVVGNFPYNISTQILFKILDWKEQVPVITGMFQKEVALRIAAAPGSKIYGVTSVLMQAFYDVAYLFDVSEQSFNPPPKVKSGVIRLKRRETTEPMRSARAFTVLVKTAFNQRRKTLRNAARALFTEDILKEDIFTKRAEQLSVADFAQLSFKMK